MHTHQKITRWLASLLLFSFFLAGLPISTQAAPDAAFIRVPQDLSNLQDAINQVSDGGVIEINAGTYTAPSNGFQITNLNKGFTIRAAPGASATLSGGGSKIILRFMNSTLAQGRTVYFERLIFADGYSAQDGLAAGVTMRQAQGVFTGVTFKNNNGNQPITAGGGIVVASGSSAVFTDCLWQDNRAKNFGGGLTVSDQSTVKVFSSQFLGNRTNYPGHLPTAAGGGIHVGNSTLSVFNSRFENNQAGYVGAGLYAIGTWKDPVTTPAARVYVYNSTFVNNLSKRDPSVSFHSPTEGGAFHAEDQTKALIYHSTFTTNQANIGGAVSNYRADIEIMDSFFFGNRATGIGSANGFGAAISATSNDGNDATTGYGAYNRPSARLTVRSTLIQGRYSTVTTVGQAAGGLYAAGDGYRVYGISVPKMGTVADNRAQVVVENVIFNDLDVQETADRQPGTGTGGALVTDLAEIHMNNSLVTNSDAFGQDAQGGGLLFINQSLAYVTGVTVAYNTSQWLGGGIMAQGSEIHITQNALFGNEVSPGVSETVGVSYGAAVFSSPDSGRNLNVNGSLDDNILSANVGLPVFDDDRNGPINEVRYNDNQVYSTSFGGTVYTDSLPNYCCKDLSWLNSATIVRSNGTTTKKSFTPNSSLSSQPALGYLISVPSYYDEVNGNYLGYAWSGSSAKLDNVTLTNKAGVVHTTQPGEHTLVVSTQTYRVDLPCPPPVLYLPAIVRR